MSVLLALVFLLSGSAALVYQVVWTRHLVVVLGATSEAFAITVACFMAGLALGAAAAPRFARRLSRPVRVYAGLEVGIALCGAVMPWALRATQPLYLWLEHAGVPGGRVMLTAALLLAPTSLMGATLPVLARLVRERIGRDIALLYGANTLGATLGCLVAGFALIELLGLTATARVAVVANLLSAALAGLLDRGVAPEAEEPPTPRMPALFPAVFAVSGFCSLGLEVAWPRLLVPRTGSQIYVFSAILAVYLAGIGLGSLAHAARRTAGGLREFAAAQAFIGVGSLLVLALCSGAWIALPSWALIPALMPATFGMGWAFPLGIALATPTGSSASASTGRLTAWNTLGGIAGSLATVFLLAPALGSEGAAAWLAALYVALGAWIALRAGGPRLALALAAVAVAIVAASSLRVPPLRHPVFARLAHPRASLLEHEEDRVAAVTSFLLDLPRRREPQYHLLVNGIGMTVLTSDTKLLAHLPGVLHPDAQRALVLCFGMGTAFRSSLAYPYERVDAVELVPSVPKMMPYYHQDAAETLSDPRGHVILDDARHYLAAAEARYDIISSDPPPPLRSAGTVLLLSREFYEAGRERLETGGLFVQWLPFGDGTLRDYEALVRTFRSVFPHVSAWRSLEDYGFFVIGSEDELRFDVDRAEAVLSNPRVWKDLVEWKGARFGSAREAAQALAALQIANTEELDAAIAPGPLVTDDHPISEYHLLRTRFGWDRTPLGRARTVLDWVGGRRRIEVPATAE